MPNHNGVSCHITIDGEQLAEYSPVIQDNTCTVWIISKDDKTYCVDLHAYGTTSSQHQIKFWADGQYLVKSDLRDSRKANISRIWEGKNAEGQSIFGRPTFSGVQTADDDRDVTEKRDEIISHVGSLKLSLWRCLFTPKFNNRLVIPPNIGSRLEDSKVETTGTIKEKVLKGLPVSHCTKLSDQWVDDAKGKERKRRRRYTADLIDSKNNPLVTFIFKYASEAILKAAGHIPRSPSPIDQDIQQMSQEDLHREVMRLREEVSGKRKIKEESEIDQNEAMSTPARKKRKPIVIDLTLDDDAAEPQHDNITMLSCKESSTKVNDDKEPKSTGENKSLSLEFLSSPFGASRSHWDESDGD